ncbi:MAG: hypothetical protein ACK53Y_26295, partial [bacterium]
MMMLTSAWIVEAVQRAKQPRPERAHWLLTSLRSLIRTSILFWAILSYGMWFTHQNYLTQIQP